MIATATFILVLALFTIAYVMHALYVDARNNDHARTRAIDMRNRNARAHARTTHTIPSHVHNRVGDN